MHTELHCICADAGRQVRLVSHHAFLQLKAAYNEKSAGPSVHEEEHQPPSVPAKQVLAQAQGLSARVSSRQVTVVV